MYIVFWVILWLGGMGGAVLGRAVCGDWGIVLGAAVGLMLGFGLCFLYLVWRGEVKTPC